MGYRAKSRGIRRARRGYSERCRPASRGRAARWPRVVADPRGYVPPLCLARPRGRLLRATSTAGVRRDAQASSSPATPLARARDTARRPAIVGFLTGAAGPCSRHWRCVLRPSWDLSVAGTAETSLNPSGPFPTLGGGGFVKEKARSPHPFVPRCGPPPPSRWLSR